MDLNSIFFSSEACLYPDILVLLVSVVNIAIDSLSLHADFNVYHTVRTRKYIIIYLLKCVIYLKLKETFS